MAFHSGHDLMNDEELRIVMVGKTGIGKSASGNSILGRKCFESKFGAQSMTTFCSKGRGTVDGQRVSVIDTPGLFDTRFGVEKTAKDISQCISYASPGPHVFLVVIRMGRYTEEEQQTVQKIQEIFGPGADRYTMVLFTGGDQLELAETAVEDFLAESPELQELVARCNGQYHVFNNMKNDHSQVSELLQKIRNTVQRNGGHHYTTEMFQEAERALEEEKKRILKQKEEQIRKEREEIERKLQQKYEKEMQRINAQIQAEKAREKIEREEEKRRAREDMDEERKREREERQAERQKEKEEKERELRELKEQFESDLMEERKKLDQQYETKARGEAEDSNPIQMLMQTVQLLAGLRALDKQIKKLFK